MIKVVEFFKRRPDLAPEAFLAHWQERHTPIVLGINGLRRYVQNPVMGLAGLPTAGFDGVVEAWFDSLETMRDNGRSAYWPVVVEDERRFIDRDSRQLILTASVDPPLIEPGPKLMLLINKEADCSVAEFQQRLHGGLGAMAGCVGLQACNCDLPIASSYDKPRRLAGDAVVSLRFATWRDAEGVLATPAYTALLADAARTMCLAVDERVIKQ